VLTRFLKSFLYTREVYRISRQLGGEPTLSFGDKTAERAIERMKQLWRTNELLAPLLHRRSVSPEELAEYFWRLEANGAGQWIRGYYVSVAALCFPVPLHYVLEHISAKTARAVAGALVDYFEGGDPYLPIPTGGDA